GGGKPREECIRTGGREQRRQRRRQRTGRTSSYRRMCDLCAAWRLPRTLQAAHFAQLCDLCVLCHSKFAWRRSDRKPRSPSREGSIRRTRKPAPAGEIGRTIRRCYAVGKACAALPVKL